MGRAEKTHPVDSLERYLSIVDSSKFLNKCTRTVKNYTRKGILRARRFKGQGGTLWIRAEDLKALKEIGDEKLSTADIWDLLKTIKLRLRSIESNMNFLMRISGLDISTLRDAKIDVLLAAYDETCEFLCLNSQDMAYTEMQQWAILFLQFTEIEFDRLVSPTMDMQPWKPFHQLCLHLMNTLRQKKGFSNHRSMQEVYRLLDKARKQIARSALVFEETRSGKMGARHVAKIASFGITEDSLDRYITSEAQKSSTH